jgi:hypothetical protein
MLFHRPSAVTSPRAPPRTKRKKSFVLVGGLGGPGQKMKAKSPPLHRET